MLTIKFISVNYSYLWLIKNLHNNREHNVLPQPVEKLEIQIDWISSFFNFRIKLKYFSKNEER